jgi:large subunit ribosomal protein L13
MRTWIPKGDDRVERNWWIVDAKDQTLGRLATKVANVLRGKNKAQFTPNEDVGDFVIVINSKQIKMTGNKLTEKKYYRHSRYFGSLKEFSAQEMLEKDPEHIIREAVKGMLPHNKLSYKIINKLKVYTDANHPHSAQRPQALS